MHVEYTGRHAEISPEFRQLAEKKLKKLGRVLDRITDVGLTLTGDKQRLAVELNVLSPNLSLNAVEEGHDDIAALNAVMDRVLRQAQRHRGKVRERKRRAPARATALWAGVISPWPTTPPGAGPEGLLPRPAGGDDGIPVQGAAATAGDGAQGNGPRVVRSRRFVVRTMSVAEAAREVETTEEGFLVFRESQSQKTNVLYRRKDGTLGLIEPEA